MMDDHSKIVLAVAMKSDHPSVVTARDTFFAQMPPMKGVSLLGIMWHHKRQGFAPNQREALTHLISITKLSHPVEIVKRNKESKKQAALLRRIRELSKIVNA